MHIRDKTKVIALSIILLLAFGLRVYQLDKVPPSLYYDEIDAAYQARSFLETGKGYRDSWNLFYFHSFLSPYAPLPIYLIAISTALIPDQYPEWQVRLPSAILGGLTVVLLFLLVRRWTKNFWLSCLTALVMAVSPWLLQVNRYAHENNSAMFLIVLGVWLLTKGLEESRYRWVWLAMVSLSLATYSYRTMSFFIPGFLVFIFMLYFRELKSKFQWGKCLLLPLTAVLIVGPLIYATTAGFPDKSRISQLVVWSDQSVPVWVQRHREVDSGDYQNPQPGSRAVWWSYLFHSKPISWIDSFSNNYLSAWSSQFLFTEGDGNRRHAIGGMGMLYTIDALALIWGMIYLWQNRQMKNVWLIIGWLALSPMAAALTSDGGNHGIRLFLLSVPLLIVVSYGWYFIISNLSGSSSRLSLSFPRRRAIVLSNRRESMAGSHSKVAKLTSNSVRNPTMDPDGHRDDDSLAIPKTGYSQVWKTSLLLALLVAWTLQVTFYLHKYYVHYPIESVRYWGYGFKQAAVKLQKLEGQFDQVMMATSYDPPMMYYLYWAKIDPKLVQKYGTDFSPEHKGSGMLDKFKELSWPAGVDTAEDVAKYLRPRTLYLVTRTELDVDLREGKPAPPGIKVHEVIQFPDNEVAFYLISKDVVGR